MREISADQTPTPAAPARRARSIPGPTGWPVLGVIPQMMRDPLALFTAVARDYGRIAYLPGINSYMIGEPQLIRTVLLDREGEAARFVKSPRVMKRISVAVGNGMSTLNGERWQRQRSIANPAFASSKVATYGGIIERETEAMVRSWAATPGRVVDITAEAKRLSFNIAMSALFSADLSGRVEEITGHLEVLQDYAAYCLWSPLPLPPAVPTPRNLRYRNARAAIEGIVAGLIQRRRAEGVDRFDDLLSAYIRACDDPSFPEMDETQLQQEVLNLFLANHDTTANSITFTFYLLSQHPQILAKLREELGRVIGDRDPTTDELDRLDYLNCVYKEALRLYPPSFAMSRTTACEVEFDGYVFPKGSNLLISQWTLHRDPDFWERPEEFAPERFSADASARRDKFHYLPFGAGPRICIGARMATAEACMVLARVLRQLDLTYLSDRPPTLYTKLFVTARPGIQMRVTSRQGQS